MDKAHLKSDKPPPKTLIYQGFWKLHFERVQNAWRKAQSKKVPCGTFFDKLQKTSARRRMFFSLLARRPGHIPACQHMEVQVLDGLARLVAAVVDDTVALHAQLLADLHDDLEAVGHHGAVVRRNGVGAADVLLGHDQEMGGRLGVDVVEGVALLVLVDLIAGDLAVDDGSEQAIVLHGLSPFDGFFTPSRPGRAGRRCFCFLSPAWRTQNRPPWPTRRPPSADRCRRPWRCRACRRPCRRTRRTRTSPGRRP